MRVDLASGKRIDLKNLAQREGVHYSTLWRWAVKGLRGIKLPTRCIGRKRITTEEAFDWWSKQITAAADGNDPRLVEQHSPEPDVSEAS
jgi:hypothetical protein